LNVGYVPEPDIENMLPTAKIVAQKFPGEVFYPLFVHPNPIHSGKSRQVRVTFGLSKSNGERI
jgi:hypothetical protein